MAAVIEGERAVRAQRFRCDNCAADMTFDAASGRLRCGHCGATSAVPAGAGVVAEKSLEEGLAQAPRGLGAGGGVKTSRCQECGAGVAFADGVTATACSFCGSPNVLEQSENTRALRPESLLPFQLDKTRANRAFAGWLSKLWFRPSDLRRMAQVQEVNGVYVPFWTFDAQVRSDWTAEAGYKYQETESYTSEENGRTVRRERQVERIRWKDAEGSRADDFDELLVCASAGLPPELAEGLVKFDTHRLVPYAPGYLSGWRAEEYAVDLEAGWGRGREKIAEKQRQRCAQDVPGDTHRNLVVHDSFLGVTWKHVLLPVWIAAYRYNGKVYRFLVNGQTEEVVGTAPYSAAKIIAFLATLGAAIFALWFFLRR
jgi:ribosomal protein S27AE